MVHGAKGGSAQQVFQHALESTSLTALDKAERLDGIEEKIAAGASRSEVGKEVESFKNTISTRADLQAAGKELGSSIKSRKFTPNHLPPDCHTTRQFFLHEGGLDPRRLQVNPDAFLEVAKKAAEETVRDYGKKAPPAQKKPPPEDAGEHTPLTPEELQAAIKHQENRLSKGIPEERKRCLDEIEELKKIPPEKLTNEQKTNNARMLTHLSIELKNLYREETDIKQLFANMDHIVGQPLPLLSMQNQQQAVQNGVPEIDDLPPDYHDVKFWEPVIRQEAAADLAPPKAASPSPDPAVVAFAPVQGNPVSQGGRPAVVAVPTVVVQKPADEFRKSVGDRKITKDAVFDVAREKEGGSQLAKSQQFSNMDASRYTDPNHSKGQLSQAHYEGAFYLFADKGAKPSSLFPNFRNTSNTLEGDLKKLDTLKNDKDKFAEQHTKIIRRLDRRISHLEHKSHGTFEENGLLADLKAVKDTLLNGLPGPEGKAGSRGIGGGGEMEGGNFLSSVFG